MLENFTVSGSQSQQKPQPDCPGLILTDTSRLGDIAEHVVITEALKRGADVYKNVGCTGKTDIVIDLNGSLLAIDVKVEKWFSSTCSYGSRGVCNATKDRVLVNPSTWKVRWPKGKAPEGWHSFWN